MRPQRSQEYWTGDERRGRCGEMRDDAKRAARVRCRVRRMAVQDLGRSDDQHEHNAQAREQRAQQCRTIGLCSLVAG
jgi:hypothetical protein